MSQSGTFENHGSDFTWLPAIAVATLFHASIIGIGYWQPHDSLLDLISQGEQAANDPPAPAAGDFFEVEWAAEPVTETPIEPPLTEPTVEPVPVPEPVVATPEFVEPVAEKPPKPPKETPKEPEPIKPIEKPKPLVASKPSSPQKTKETLDHRDPTPRPATPKNPNAPTGTGPQTSAGTNPNGKVNPDFAPSDLIVGNKNFPKPPYPMEARQKRLQGTVLLKISVASGRVSNVVVIKSSGHALLDSTASRFVKGNWKFPPGLTRSLNQKIQFGISS